MKTIELISERTPELNRRELDLIEKAIHEVEAEYYEFDWGDVLLDEIKVSNDLWITLEGRFAISISGSHICNIGPGSLIGEINFLRENRERKISVISDRKSSALKLPHTKLLKILEANDQRAAWHHLFSVELASKLSNTTRLNVVYSDFVTEKENLLKMFSSEFSLAHIRAFLRGDANTYKTVSAIIWFSDLAGFSSQISQLEPMEAGRVVQRLLQHQANILMVAGAHIDKFMGDGIMAFWILRDDQIQTNTIETAVEAALKVGAETPEVSKALGLDINIRIGLHFGKAIAGNFGSEGRIAHTLIGANVNLAARYEQANRDEKNEQLMPVRLSPSIYDKLSEALRQHFSQVKQCQVKHGQIIPVHDGPRIN